IILAWGRPPATPAAFAGHEKWRATAQSCAGRPERSGSSLRTPRISHLVALFGPEEVSGPAVVAARAFHEMVESERDSRESLFVIQASNWTGGQHGWGSHTQTTCDEALFYRLRRATPMKRPPSSLA